MEPETGAAAKGKDSDDDQNDQNAPDSSSLTGQKADQDQQILMDTGDTNWYKSTQALKYLQPVFVPIVKDKMKSLQLQCKTDFGRHLCAEATSDDIIQANNNMAEFKHLCPGTVDACQKLLNIIKGHTTDSVRFYQMLKGTDPQQWLKSPFEFVCLFLKDWMRCDIHDFQECDITALCTIVKRCKPLMQIFDKGKLDSLRKVRNRTMHPATMSISQHEMENNIDVILDFLEHIKSLKSTDEVTEAIERIKQLRTGDVRLLHSMVVILIQGWLPGARLSYEHKCDQAKNQLQDILYMENKLARLSSGPETSPIKQSAGHDFGAKIEQPTDGSQTLKQKTEDMVKMKEETQELEKQNEENEELSNRLKEEKRELEKQNEERIRRLEEEKRELEEENEELSKRLKEEKRELEKQNKELSKRLRIQHEAKRKLEEQNTKLKERLETKEGRSFGEVCLPKEESAQRSPDDTIEVEEPRKRSASGGCFPIQALSACTSSGNKGKKVQKRRPSWSRLKDGLPFSTRTRSDLGPSLATVCTDVSPIPVKSDKDQRRCYITGMVAISGTQLMLADENNKCIKLLDLETGTVIGIKELPSAPHDVTCVPGSRVAVTMPALHQIHVFTADNKFKQRGIMSVNGDCLGIHCSGDRFFVSCKNPPLVEILNIDGGRIKTIQLAAFEYPIYLTCSPDNKFIYVSNFYNTVTCMDMAGSVQWRYSCKYPQSAGLTFPQSVCTGDRCIYISSFDEIYVVSPTGNKLACIPFRITGARNAAVCYNSQDRTLYVSPFPSVAEENTHIIRIRMH